MTYPPWPAYKSLKNLTSLLHNNEPRTLKFYRDRSGGGQICRFVLRMRSGLNITTATSIFFFIQKAMLIREYTNMSTEENIRIIRPVAHKFIFTS